LGRDNIQIAHVLVHEILHGELHHFERGRLLGVSREDWEDWNIACDIEIERRIFNLDMLGVGARESVMREHRQLFPFPYDFYGREPIAEELFSRQRKRLGGLQAVLDLDCDGRMPSNVKIISGGSKLVVEVAREQMREAVERGDAPAEYQSLIRARDVLFHDPIKRFMSVLRSKVHAREKELVISRPERRLITQGKKFPRRRRRLMPFVVVAVDTSGSMLDVDLARILGAMNSLARQYSFMVITCDAEVHQVVEEFTPRMIQEFEGRGGTSFVPVFDYIREHKIQVSALVFFTDLEGEFPVTPPHYPVIWIDTSHHQSDDVPFGTVVRFPPR